MTDDRPTDPSARKPRVALMGEFSAGKSTLANLLLGQNSSPVQVTATQLPPVWYQLGTPGARRIGQDGSATPLPADDWSAVSPEDTRMIQAQLDADILQACDLIDLPGTSDPNMAPDFWDAFLPKVDLAIWCTPANQAWRQSEAALWEQVPPQLWTKSLLLITRIDKMQAERDRARVFARVRAEAGALFRDVLPISLTGALAGRDNDDVLEATGAAALVRFLCHALEGLEPPAPVETPRATAPTPPASRSRPAAPSAGSGTEPRIVPRRITRSKSQGARSRPEHRHA
ncbi:MULTISPECIES: GTPase [unclassified Mameliella]|uniref:GTPase n=1 Tax=unclassified Mameliella TaxID=2630630 RepID=UPI00273F8F3D|nr:MULTISPECIES: GTPase [unclassified Mameliella]